MPKKKNTDSTVANASVPVASDIINSKKELAILSLAVKNKLPVLMIGETGTGKTSLVRHLAKINGAIFRRINLNGGTTNDELIGKYAPDPVTKGFRWIDGVLVEAMKRGEWLLLDELNASTPEVLFTLHSLLDDDNMIVVAEHEGEIVKPVEGFRFFGTMNPSAEYSGTKELNRALLSRFPIVMHLDWQNAGTECKIIQHHAKTTSSVLGTTLVKIAQALRRAKKDGSLSYTCSTRDLIYTAKLIECGLSPQEACLYAIEGKADNELDKIAITDILKLRLGEYEAGTVKSIEDLEAELNSK